MKIKIYNDDVRAINIYIPNWLITNRIVCFYITKVIKKYKVEINPKDLVKVMKLIKRIKKTNKEWNILEVETSDNERVIVKI